MHRSFRLLLLCMIFGLITAFVACSQKKPEYTPEAAEATDATPMAGEPTGSAPAPAQASRYAAPPRPASKRAAPADTAKYTEYKDNGGKQVAQTPLSTFSLDVDTASYANARRFLTQGRMPNPDAVRVEEMLNYFPWNAAEQHLNRLGNSPFEAAYELAPCPWDKSKTLLYLTVRAASLHMNEAPPANLVFLVDVSGSMDSPERLPLVKASLKLLVDRLRPQDKISMVTYSGSTKVVLQPTSGADKAAIRAAIEQLDAGGSTAGGAGLTLAYEQAEKGFIKDGVNRILMCTDGDFNVGVSSREELTAMVQRKRDAGVTLSVLGYGTDNYNDAMMVKVADEGNGNYSYIDTLTEAQKVLGEEMSATLVTVAKDVKAQIEFNPAMVLEYRQIGYEKRQLRDEDFNNDKADAGDIGAGKQVIVLYELTLAGGKASVDPLRYGNGPDAQGKPAPAKNFSNEFAFVKLRWKAPHGQTSEMVSLPVTNKALVRDFAAAGTPLRFSAAVAAYGQKLRNNPQLTSTAWKDIAAWADAAKGADPGGYRSEFVKLVGLAESLAK